MRLIKIKLPDINVDPTDEFVIKHEFSIKIPNISKNQYPCSELTNVSPILTF